MLKFLDATAGFVLCWAAGWIRYWLRRDRTIPSCPVRSDVRRILVIRPGGMGDMVLLLPVLNALRRDCPGAKIELVCEKRNSAILKLAGFADCAVLYDASPFGLLRRLLRGGYDVAIDTEQFHYFSALMVLLARAPVRIGFKINPGRNLLYTHLVTYDMDGYEADQFARLLRPLGVELREPDTAGCLTAGGADTARFGGFYVAMHVGSTTRYKSWSADKFGQLARQLADRAGARIVLVGGRGDRGASREVAGQAALGDRLVSVAGDLALAETAAVIRGARLFVGGDSGLAHVAVALGVPTVTLFGPSDSRKWGVRSERNAVVEKDLACAPCFIFGYHKLCRTVACMATISVDDVLAACSTIMPAPGSAPGQNPADRA